ESVGDLWSNQVAWSGDHATTQTEFKTAQPLLLPLALNVKLLLLAPELRRSLPLKLVPVDRQGVVDGDRVTHELSHGGERQLPVLEFRFLDLLVLLVRPVHRPDELVPLL